MKFNLYLFSALVALLVGISACQDESLMTSSVQSEARANTEVSERSSGLVLQEDGYWKAVRRVPLVGQGRIVDNLSGALISVGALGNNAPNLVDLDLTNTFAASGVIDAQVATNQIVSIRDLNYVYAGGQKAGFVCKAENGSVLSLDVLQGFWIDIYLKGEKQEHYVFTNATSVLDLGLGNITNGSENSTFLVETTFSKPFDEIRIGINGVNATVAGALSIYYAYVGENPMIPAVNDGNTFFNDQVTVDGTYASSTLRKLIDADLDNGVTIELLTGLVGGNTFEVDFGREVPVGTEVGYIMTYGSVLDLGVGASIILSTFDENGNELDEYTYTKIVELGLLGGGQTIFSLTTTKPCHGVKLVFAGVKLDLGAKTIHYAFVREKTEPDVTSYYTLANATVYNPNYRFVEPEKGTVTYELVSGPNRHGASIAFVDGKPYLKGMNIAGNYMVKATYTDENGNTFEQTAVITRLKKKLDACDQHLENTTDNPNVFEAYIPDGTGGILIGIGNSQDAGEKLNYVVDDDSNNYLTYTGGLDISLITNQSLIGVKRKDGNTINPDKNNIRTGFVINKSLSVLGADVLQFLRIKLYLNGKEVDGGLAKDNNGVSVSLVGTSLQKTRLSIDTSVEFDQIELYSSGVLDLDLIEDLNIYYAFWEVTDGTCGDPGEECMQLISNANYGAMATVETKGLADVGGTITNLGNIVDGTIESFATLVKPLGAGTDTELKVTFNTVKANQEVGFILSDVTGLTNVELIGIMQIKAYNNGQEVTSTTQGSGLGLKLVGSGDRRYISITPPEDIDELRLIIGQGVGAVTTYKVNGVYLRPDYDGDRVMDCITDELSSDITDLYVEPENICLGDESAFRVDGGEEGVTYTLQFVDKKTGTVSAGNVTINSTSYLEFTDKNFFATLPVGEYYVSVLHEGEVVLNRIGEMTIHPNETTWQGDTSTDWNDWENWDRGVPWECTNVILPSDLDRYPILVKEGVYCCHHIHFEAGSELIGQNYLRYLGNAFVDMKLKGGYYHLLSMPLKEMVTGDMFLLESNSRSSWEDWRNTIASDGIHTNFFTLLDETDAANRYLEHRVDPMIYQRFFSRTVTNATISRASNTNDPAIKQTDWSRTFNAVATPYEVGQGFALRAGAANDNSDYLFHFPKAHNLYRYYDVAGALVGKEEAIVRAETNVGKLMIDNKLSMPCTVILTRKDNGMEFLFGNPFMSHIDIQRFLEVNASVISSIQIYRGGNYITIQADGTSSQSGAPTLIEPMEAVFVVSKKKGDAIKVVFSDDMLKPGTETMRSRTLSDESSQLYVTATSAHHTASCTVVQSSSADNGYLMEEDIHLLIESEDKPEVSIYSLVDNQALSIQRMKNLTSIPMDIGIDRTCDVELSFESQGDYWKGWVLEDRLTGQKHVLSDTVKLTVHPDQSNRLFLIKQ